MLADSLYWRSVQKLRFKYVWYSKIIAHIISSSVVLADRKLIRTLDALCNCIVARSKMPKLSWSGSKMVPDKVVRDSEYLVFHCSYHDNIS